VLAVTQREWGERIAENVGRYSPTSWTINRWAAPRALPLLIDDPAEFLPPALPTVDLVLALGDTAAVAQLIPEIVRLTGARSVIAPIDRNESLPPGLATQLQGWLADLGVAVVFPKPFCTLTETSYNLPPIRVEYDDPFIAAFARVFGQPRFGDPVVSERRLERLSVARDSACGCARHVARGLIGCPVAEAEHAAGLLHHHYPCLAGMSQDADYHDTLMHVSGHLVREAVRQELKDHLDPVPYLRPMGRVGADTGKE
jgi:hypothetical protein